MAIIESTVTAAVIRPLQYILQEFIAVTALALTVAPSLCASAYSEAQTLTTG